MEENDKPVLDERALGKLLEAAYVVQEHNRKLQALGVRIVPDDLQDSGRPEKSVSPAESVPAQAPDSAIPPNDDYTLTLARIVETQHQIQLRRMDLDNTIAMVAQRVAAIARAGGAAIGMLDAGKMRYKAASGLMTLPAGDEIPAEKALSAPCLRGQIIRCRDLDVEFVLDAEECRRRGIQAMIAVPIYQVGGVAGSLEVYYASKHAFTEQDVHTCQLMAGLVTETLARGDQLTWKKSLDSERSVMMEALERLKPDLAAQVSASTEDPAVTPTPVRAAAPPSPCNKCGHDLVGEEQFCGYCGWPRGAAYDRPRDAGTASIWNRQRTAPDPLASLTNGAVAPREPQASSNGRQHGSGLADSIERESPGLFSLAAPETETGHAPSLDHPAETNTGDDNEASPSEAVLAKAPPTSAWTSAAATREFLEQVAAARPSNALLQFWNARRGDIYLAIAVILVACVIRWGIWSNHPVSATVRQPAATAQQKPAPDADLSTFDRILIKLGLAVPPEAPESKGNPDAQVWVDLHTGFYYCSGTDLYGKTPKGKLAKQRDAQLDQYEPADGKVCE